MRLFINSFSLYKEKPNVKQTYLISRQIGQVPRKVPVQASYAITHTFPDKDLYWKSFGTQKRSTRAGKSEAGGPMR